MEAYRQSMAVKRAIQMQLGHRYRPHWSIPECKLLAARSKPCLRHLSSTTVYYTMCLPIWVNKGRASGSSVNITSGRYSSIPSDCFTCFVFSSEERTHARHRSAAREKTTLRGKSWQNKTQDLYKGFGGGKGANHPSLTNNCTVKTH